MKLTDSETFLCRAICAPSSCQSYSVPLTEVIFRTSGENIGDSGLIQAYRAWHGQFHTESFEEGGTREPLLPGLNYTQEQLFFIGFGQIWAQLIKPAAAVRILVLYDGLFVVLKHV